MAKILYFDKNVIHQSKVNGAPYVESEHIQKWAWPKSTWMRKRLAELAQGDERKDDNHGS